MVRKGQQTGGGVKNRHLLSTSCLRTSLSDVYASLREEDFFVIEGVLQCKLTTCILKVVVLTQ